MMVIKHLQYTDRHLLLPLIPRSRPQLHLRLTNRHIANSQPRADAGKDRQPEGYKCEEVKFEGAGWDQLVVDFVQVGWGWRENAEVWVE